MAYLDYRNRIKRVDFSKNEKVQEIPNLIQVQQESYAEFLQADIPPEKRRDVGLQTVFKGSSPSPTTMAAPLSSSSPTRSAI